MLTLRTNDPARKPSHWSEIIRPGQFAVFIVDAHTHVARDANGGFFEGNESTIALCEDLAEAKAFAQTVVDRLPDLCCQIYDHEGKSKDPLEVIYHHETGHKYVGPRYHRRERIYGCLALAVGITFIVIDAKKDLVWIWGYVIGIKACLIGVAFLVRGFAGWHETRPGYEPPGR